jgi:hypothetical protein
MKSKDQTLLEEAYLKVVLNESLQVTDKEVLNEALLGALARIGSKLLPKIKSWFLNPDVQRMLLKTFKVTAPIVIAIASGDYAQAAESAQEILTPEQWGEFMKILQGVFESNDREQIQSAMKEVEDYYYSAMSNAKGSTQIDTVADQYLSAQKAYLNHAAKGIQSTINN